MKFEYPDNLRTLMKQTEFIISADYFAQMALWEQYHDKITWWNWDAFSLPIGTLGQHPIWINCNFKKLNGHLVVFYVPASSVVDHGLIKAWLEDQFSQCFVGCKHHCDARNFMSCLEYCKRN